MARNQLGAIPKIVNNFKPKTMEERINHISDIGISRFHPNSIN